MPDEPQRILALDPGTRHTGIAVLEGDRLLYYGVREFKKARPACHLVRATRTLLKCLIFEFEPAVLAYEAAYFPQAKTIALLRCQERAIAKAGQAAGLTVVSLSPPLVREIVCGDPWATKIEVALTLTERFPELKRYLVLDDEVRQRYWFHMFDAVAVAVACSERARKWLPNGAVIERAV